MPIITATSVQADPFIQLVYLVFDALQLLLLEWSSSVTSETWIYFKENVDLRPKNNNKQAAPL